MEESPLVQRMFSLFGTIVACLNRDDQLSPLPTDADGTGSIDCKEFLVGISSFVGASKDDRMKCA